MGLDHHKKAFVSYYSFNQQKNLPLCHFVKKHGKL